MSQNNITTAQIIVPVTLLSVVLLIFLGFQTAILVSDRNTLNQAIAQQEPVLTQLEKVKSQLKALATGASKLAQQGDRAAMNITAQLKKVGYSAEDSSQSPSMPASGMAPTGHLQPSAPPAPATAPAKHP